MKTLLTPAALAALLAGWAGFASAAPDAAPSTAPDAQASGGCCGGGKMAGMMKNGMKGMMSDDAAHDGHAAEKVKLTAEQQKSVDDLTTAYLSAQKKLAADSAEGVADSFKQIDKAADALAESDDATLKAAAEKVAEAAHAKPETLDAARDAYKTLSAAVAGLAKIAPPSDAAAPKLYEVYCPMAKASWLQTSKDVANPYLGKAMSTCGKVKATVKGDSAR